MQEMRRMTKTRTQEQLHIRWDPSSSRRSLRILAMYNIIPLQGYRNSGPSAPYWLST